MTTAIESLQTELAEAEGAYRALVWQTVAGETVPRAARDKAIEKAGHTLQDFHHHVTRAAELSALAERVAEIPDWEEKIQELSDANEATRLEIEAQIAENDKRLRKLNERIHANAPKIAELQDALGQCYKARNALGGGDWRETVFAEGAR